MSSNIFTLFGLAIDFAVSSIFAFRLYKLHKSKPNNKLIFLFMLYFAIFSLFIIATPFYLPTIFSSNSLFLKVSFIFAFLILLFVSNLQLRIASLVLDWKKIDKILSVIWIILSAIILAFLIFTIDPSAPLNNGLPWGFTRTSAMFIGIFFGLSFFFTSFAFYLRAFTVREEKLKYFLLGTSFLLVIMGGPMHQFSMPYYLFADILTTLGFVSAFLALIIKDK